MKYYWHLTEAQPVCISLKFFHLNLYSGIHSSSPGSSVHGILQARILEWGIISFSETTLYLELELSNPPPTSGKGLEVSSITNGQWCNQSHLHNAASINLSPPPNNTVERACRLENTLKCWEGDVPQESMDALASHTLPSSPYVSLPFGYSGVVSFTIKQ